MDRSSSHYINGAQTLIHQPHNIVTNSPGVSVEGSTSHATQYKARPTDAKCYHR